MLALKPSRLTADNNTQKKTIVDTRFFFEHTAVYVHILEMKIYMKLCIINVNG